MRFSYFFFLFFALGLPITSTAGETVSAKAPSAKDAGSTPSASFSQKPGSAQVATIAAKSGDSIRVTVTDTCTDYFQLAIENLVAASSPPQLGAEAIATGCSGKDQLSATIVYDTQYSAYIVKVSAKDGVAIPVKVAGGAALNPQDFVIYINTASPWTTDFSGGFTISSLRNSKWSLQPSGTAGSGTFVVSRDSSSQDSVSLGFAGFVTVSKNDWTLPAAIGAPKYGLTFGLGVNTGSKLEFYPGFSLGFGDLWLTLGANVGSIDALPSGLREGGATTQSNALNSLPTRISAGAFISLSYKFLGSSVQKTLEGKISTPAAK